jgi:hypothetical protein
MLATWMTSSQGALEYGHLGKTGLSLNWSRIFSKRWNVWIIAIMEKRERTGAHYRYDDTSLFGRSPRFGRNYTTTSNFRIACGYVILHIARFLTRTSFTMRRLGCPQHDHHNPYLRQIPGIGYPRVLEPHRRPTMIPSQIYLQTTLLPTR